MNLLYFLFSTLAALLWVVNGSNKGKDFKECPYPEDIEPHCTCKEFGTFALMFCSKMTNANDLIIPLNATKKLDIMSITISDSAFNYIPENIFENTTFQKVFLRESKILSLSDTDVAFKGLENWLEELRVVGVEFISKWDWSQIRKLQRLNSIDINNVLMPSLESEFPRLKALHALGISKSKLSFIVPQAFKALSNLQWLVLRENEISSMSRDMLPMPALRLRHLDLSNNNLDSLPNDMFTKMPNLQELLIMNNKFVSLNQETFSIVLSNSFEFLMKGNKIKCDCRIKWMAGHAFPTIFDGTCNEPEELRSKSLRFFKEEELICK